MRPSYSQNRVRSHSAHHAQYFFLMTSLTLLCALILGIGLVSGFTQISFLLPLPFAVGAAGFLLFNTGRKYDVLHPVRVFGSIWCFCLALAPLRLVTPISLWGPLMWTYVIMALLAFSGGFLMMNYFLPRRHTGPPDEALPAYQSSYLLPVRTGLVLAGICLLIGIVSLAYRYSLTGEIPVFAHDIGAAETTFFATASEWRYAEFDTLPNKIVGLLSLFCKYSIYLSCIVLFQKIRKTRTQTIIALSIIVLALLALGSQGGRGFLAEFAVATAVLFHYLRRRIRLRELVLTGALVILFLSFAGYLRARTGEAAVARQVDKISKLPKGLVWDSIAFGYFTVTRPLETFYRLTEDLPAMRFNSGGFLFYSLHRFVPRENIEELSTRLYGGDMMTPTFLGEMYGDFGAPGILVGCLLLGFAYSYVYWRALRCDSLYWLIVLVTFMTLLMYFPHANFFSQNINWLFDMTNMAWILWLAKLGKVAPVPGVSAPRPAVRLGSAFGQPHQGISSSLKS